MADHLFAPDEPPRHLRIEYHGPPYDGGDWDGYGSRHGWDTLKFPRGKMPEDLRSAIECKLYFGMLQYVFGDQLDQSDFLLRAGEGEDESQSQYITTKHLEKYIGTEKHWKKHNLSARVTAIVPKVCDELTKFSSYLRHEMVFAIQLLCHALWNVADKRDGPLTRPRNVHIWRFLREAQAEQMVREGWCPLDAEKCRKVGAELDTPAYLMQLVRTKPAWNKRNHELCRKTECVADNVDESLYFTRHLEEDCSCDHLLADVQALHDILLEGGIPLVEITPSGEGGDRRYEIKIVKKSSSKRYVAVSHVWADGLGNPHANSLPTCQIGLLYERAKLLLTDKEYVPEYENGPFGGLHTSFARLTHSAGRSRRGDTTVLVWIDTLCIPHEREVRGLAIQRIRDTYVGAYRTMLLDSEIRQVPSHSTNNLELVLRVLYCSGWIRRLWTLQEGLAAKSQLYLMLADKPVNISTVADTLFTKLDKGKIPIFQERIARYAAGVWYSYFQHTIDAASKFERFVNVVTSPFIDGSISQDQLISWNWFNVATRASSKDGDRPIVLAGVLNLDVKEILSVKGSDERMRKFYSLLDAFPQDILFQDGPRFEDEGMRWALKVCRYADNIAYLAHGSGQITPRGLQITKYPSWLFPSRRVFDLRRFEQDDGQQVWEGWLGELGILDSDQPVKALLLKTKIPIDFSTDETHGVILDDAKGSGSGSVTACALVSLQATEDEVHYAQYTSLGTVQLFTIGVGSFPKDGYLVGATWDDIEKREWVVG
ncbi:hypothetical protein BDW75DRAFT_105779 [Aspergillus navahoensis]